MSASASNRTAALGALLALAACGEPAQYRFATNITGLLFAPVDMSEGIHPSRSVLKDPANPFVDDKTWLKNQPDGGVGTKWIMLAGPGGVPGFYAFATALTKEPTGENQYYTAQMLGEIAKSGAFVDTLTELEVRSMAVAGYRAALDYFPGSVSYLADGVTFFSVDVLAYEAAVALGDPMAGYALVEPADGGMGAVIRTTDYKAPDGGR